MLYKLLELSSIDLAREETGNLLDERDSTAQAFVFLNFVIDCLRNLLCQSVALLYIGSKRYKSTGDLCVLVRLRNYRNVSHVRVLGYDGFKLRRRHSLTAEVDQLLDHIVSLWCSTSKVLL